MNDNVDLFGFVVPQAYPDVPGHRGVETSVEAAEAIAPKIGRLQRLTLAAIAEAQAAGLTADEASERCDMDRWSIQPRVSELKLKGLIVDSGGRRFNSTGKRAIVWVTPQFQRGEAA